MMLTFLVSLACVLAVIPALMMHRNLRHFAPPPEIVPGTDQVKISLLIPARNEAQRIAATVTAALASAQVSLEVLVLDDHSEDETAAIVRKIAASDARVRLLPAPPLPPGWCGKQHACAVLATHARYPVLVFMDADVRLAPTALARLAAYFTASSADLLSGFPLQETGTFYERLLIPLMHVILLGFLPVQRMRRSRHPAYAAGCGQCFMTSRQAYEQAGGHQAIKASLHDGVRLPRAFRAAGLMTDLCDVTDLMTCRMYHSAGDVWRGLAKNATEGLASPIMIGPATLLLFGGQVLPFVLLAYGLCGFLPAGLTAIAAVGVAAAYYPRLRAAYRFRQSWTGAVLHPFGMIVLLSMQWYARWRALRGQPATWKGRTYGPSHDVVSS